MGRGKMIGTDREKKNVQVRIAKSELAEVEKARFFGHKDMSKYIVSLWKAGLEKNRTRDINEPYED